MNLTLNRRTWIQSIAGGASALAAASYLRAAGANERVRAAVIGRTGHGDYGHSLDKVWLNMPEANLVAVADDDPQGLSTAATNLKVDKAYSDYREMLDKEKPHVVSIAQRWIDKHFEMAMACAERGIHIYMEKPFVRTLAEADTLIAACKKTSTRLALACQSTYSPKAARVKELIADGKIGRVLEYRARGKEDHRGGSEDMWVLGTHVLDLIRHFGGQPTWCSASLTQHGNPVRPQDVRDGGEGLGPLAGDHVQASYGMPDGSTAYFASRQNAGRQDDRFAVQIFGSEGVIEIMTNYMAPAHYLPDPKWSPGRSGKAWQEISSAGVNQPEPLTQKGTGEGNRVAVRDLLAAVKEDREPLCGIYEARETLEMIHAVFESHRLQKAAKIPLANREHALTMLS
jgi:predicted dehydrogenase